MAKRLNNRYKLFQYISGTLEKCINFETQSDFLDAISTFKENISLCGIKGKDHYEEIEWDGAVLHLSIYEVNVGTYQVKFRAVEYTKKD